MPLIKNILKPLALALALGLATAASATDAAVHKKMFGLGMTTVIIYNEEMHDIMKVVRALEESGSLVKSFAKQLKIKLKNEN